MRIGYDDTIAQRHGVGEVVVVEHGGGKSVLTKRLAMEGYTTSYASVVSHQRSAAPISFGDYDVDEIVDGVDAILKKQIYITALKLGRAVIS